MAHWEYGIEFTFTTGNPVPTHVSYGEDLEGAVQEAVKMGRNDLYRNVGVFRRVVGDWEGFCIKTALDERAKKN